MGTLKQRLQKLERESSQRIKRLAAASSVALGAFERCSDAGCPAGRRFFPGTTNAAQKIVFEFVPRTRVTTAAALLPWALAGSGSVDSAVSASRNIALAQTRTQDGRSGSELACLPAKLEVLTVPAARHRAVLRGFWHKLTGRHPCKAIARARSTPRRFSPAAN